MSFIGFHWLAGTLQGDDGAGGIAFFTAYWAQYVIPALLLLGALILGRDEGEKTRSARRRSAPEQRDGADGSSSRASIIKLDPFRTMNEAEFHNLIKEFFCRNGFAVDEVPTGLGDGVDLMLRKNGKLFVAQHRHWRETRVGVPMVREQYMVMQAARANGVYVITSGEFTYKAIQYAEDKNISLIDGAKLRRLIRGGSPVGTKAPGAERAPVCPLCSAEMLVRGGNEMSGGKQIWSCSNYPKCTGSLEVEQS